MGSEQAIRTLCDDGGLVAECRRVLPALARMAEPAGRDKVRMALQPLVLVFGVSEAAKAPGFWEVYFDALQDFPIDAIKLAVSDYAKGPDSQFFPKPGPLRKLAADHATVSMRAYSRARAVAGSPCQDRNPAPKTAEEKAAVKRMLGEYLAAMAERHVEPPTPRANFGRTDETGLTPAMREMIARREEGT